MGGRVDGWVEGFNETSWDGMDEMGRDDVDRCEEMRRIRSI